ncbi:ribonuclease VapC [Streptomyces sp. Y2F8-2]|uniref:PIN domain nuclease n=1 Tax=Streptomyces sp. Y2F8-2 TaxID=2759675 RepID=UPI001A3D17A5|nr:PIN domain nuclease [Streptomyces sp. Y2F8-2]GHK04729.1 ribonuclease VapC [Streptomyces sp. Y2F8-2]
MRERSGCPSLGGGVDGSVRQPARSLWDEPLADCLVARCPSTEIEFLYSAKNTSDRAQSVEDLDALLDWTPLDDRAPTRARAVQQELTAKGCHRSAGAVDPLVAATAEPQGLTVLHHDNDVETIASVTGRPTRWLMPPGSL